MKTLIRIISAFGITKKNRRAIKECILKYRRQKDIEKKLVTACDIANKGVLFKKIKNDNLQLPHPVGLVIWNPNRIGKNVQIFQNTTIANDVIKVEDSVTIYASCVLHGNIVIGKGAVIAAHSLVNKNIPPYEVWGGVPAKFIRKVTKEEIKDL